MVEENRPLAEPTAEEIANRVKPFGPQYGSKSGKLTYESALNILRSGGSISHGSQLITRVDEMPTPSEWASTADERAAAKESLNKQIAELERQRQANAVAEKRFAAEQAQLASNPGNGPIATAPLSGEEKIIEEAGEERIAVGRKKN